MQKAESRFKRFVQTHIDYIIVTLVLLVLYFAILIFNEVWPFGSGTILVSDSYYQIGNFTNLFFDIFEGKGTLFYNNHLAGGMEVFSTIEYMFLCPFYILALLGGRQNIYNMFSLVVFAMLLFDLFIFLWFIKKHFKNIGLFPRILLSLLFLFSTYTQMSVSFLTWTIYPALLLLLVDAFLELLKTGKNVRFCGLLVWYVCTCFSVGISTAIILFVVFSLFILIMSSGEKRKNLIFRFSLSYLISAIICVAVLLPGLISTVVSGRVGTFTDAIMAPFESSVYIMKFVPVLLGGIITLFGLLYFIYANKHTKIYKFYWVALVILFVPIVFDCSLRLLCGTGYLGFPGRFYFLNETLLFILMLNYFDKHNVVAQVKQKQNNLFMILYIVVAAVVAFALIGVYAFYGDFVSLTTKSPYMDKELLNIVLAVFVLLLFLFVFCMIIKKKKLLSQKIFRGCVYALMMIALSINFLNLGLFFYGPNNTNIQSLIETEGLEGKFGIVGDMNLYHNIYGRNLRTNQSFSSLNSAKSACYENLGYYANTSLILSNCGTIISDALCGKKYYVAQKGLQRPYLKLIKSQGNFAIYENLLATTGAIVFDKDFEFDWDLKTASGLENFKNKLNINGSLISSSYPQIEKLESGYEEVRKIYGDGYNLYKISYTPARSEIVYSSLNWTWMENEKVREDFGSEDCFKVGGQYGSCNFELGFAEAGKPFEVYVVAASSIDMNSTMFCVLDYGVTEQVCQALQNMQAGLTYTKNGYQVEAALDHEGKLFVTNPNIDGLKFYLNDNACDVEDELGAFPTVVLSSGHNILVAEYHYPYTNVWIATIAAAIVLVVLLALLYKFGKAKWLKKAIFVSNIALVLVLIAFFEVLGVVLTFIVI